jgi:predicted transcriptional regulator
MNEELLPLTVDIVSAHVSHNDVLAADVPSLIRSTFEALSKLGQAVATEEAKPEPAVSIRVSVKHDYIICLEDGAKLKMLKRYLRTNFDMSPEEYRAKWGLPRDYPMVAPAYAEQRRTLAKSIGLGRKKAVDVAETVGGKAVKTISESLTSAREHLGGEAAKPARKPRAKKAFDAPK